MTKPITTKQLLDFLVKAYKVLDPPGHISFKKVRGDYEIGIYHDWDDIGSFFTRTTYISEEGYPDVKYLAALHHWTTSDYLFSEMNTELDYLVSEKEKEEMRRQERKELLSRLTDEEKELLGVES
jgi:hypothetical protein